MKGIFFGLTYQLLAAIGFIWVAGIARDANPVLKANIMLAIAGVAGIIILLLFALINGTAFFNFSRSDVFQLGMASMLIIVIGEAVYLTGLSASNATTIGFTALAFPAICLILDIFLQRIPLSSLTARDWFGMIFIVTGFILVSSRNT